MAQTTRDDERPRGSITPTRAVATLVRETRDRRGWTAQQLADRCAEQGMDSLDRSTVASIESGRRRRIGVDELLTLAYVLDVAPVHLVLPRADDERVSVAPGVDVSAVQAREWVRGNEQLPGRDEKTYRTEVPDSEWQRARQPSQRELDAEDRHRNAQRRTRVAARVVEALHRELRDVEQDVTRTVLGTDRRAPEERRLQGELRQARAELAEAEVDSDDAYDVLRNVRLSRELVDQLFPPGHPGRAPEVDRGQR